MTEHHEYPTESELERISTWEFADHPLEEFLAEVRSLWQYGSWGWQQTPGQLAASTGGWSGNESLIEAMQQNSLFWAMCWKSSRKGGHYIFDLTRPPVV